MSDDDMLNEVTVCFTNGDELNVDAVVRLVGAEWLTAEIVQPSDDGEDGSMDFEYVALRADDVRYIRSDRVTPAGQNGTNFRVHHTHGYEGEEPDIMFEAWIGQHQLHPDDDPSAYQGSEQKWPPDGADPRYPGEAQP
ncbi:hypothetical protein [Halorubrum sp. AJ67]|uniref:hypothetical protein n=1 Tax=Halorubrum sp. AJ67 TaxID=1173487 RepID=UPI0003DB7B48|nr:hypothetical protein [Halorubrum sp. AJ67]CDK38136.1 hypothetical protein BN903_336 [Halorubrum sp. AJ67]